MGYITKSLFPSLLVLLVVSFVVLFVFLLIEVGAAEAQTPRAEVTAVWRGGEPASDTLPGEVCLLRDADLSRADTVTVGDTLAAGDQVSAGPCGADDVTADDELLLGLRCGDGTDLQLSGPFDLLILEPDAVDCAVDLRTGTSDVLTDQPATITSGGITLGVEGTQFAITRERAPATDDPSDSALAADSLFICRLFEGRLRVRRPEKVIQLDGGEVWTYDGRNISRKPVEVNDVVAAATRAARLDVARAHVRGGLAAPAGESLETLTRRHLTTLLEPKDAGARQELVESLSRLGLDERATFESRRIESIRIDSHRLDSQRLDSQRLDTEDFDAGPSSRPGSATTDRPLAIPVCRQRTLDAERATQKIHLPIELGIVTLELPAEVGPGDQISGTLSFAASGTDRKERKHLRKLEQFQVAIGSETLPVREGTWSLRLPRGATRVELQNKRGRTQTRAALTTSARLISQPTFSPPCSCRAGFPFAIAGPFDGNLRTTRVTVGGRPARILAESPREVLVECNGNLAGGSSLVVEEAGRRHEVGDFRVVQLDVEIVPRQIERKKKATATVRLSGIAGQRQSYCLRVTNKDPDVVRMDGGDEQLIPLSPSNWRAGDSMTKVFELKGKKRGVAAVGVELLPHGCPR